MRIIAGTFRSRALQAPAGLATRPTSDRLRETLFNVLAPRIEGASFLDLYAGSGAVGIEALSRGAAMVTFVERAAPALKVLRANLDRLRITAGFRIHSGSVASFLRKPSAGSGFAVSILSFSIRLMRHPRSMRLRSVCLVGHRPACCAPDAVVIAEHRRKQALESAVRCARALAVAGTGRRGAEFLRACKREMKIKFRTNRCPHSWSLALS